LPKKIILFAVVLTGMLALSPSAVFAQTVGRATVNKLNVRDAGSLTDSKVLYMINAGEPCEIIGEEGDYYRVNLSESKGVYLAKQYVEIVYTECAILFENSWLFNNLPGDDCYGIMQLNIGDVVEVTAIYDDWFAVKFNGTQGFIPGFYVEVPGYVLLPEKQNENKTSLITFSDADPIPLSSGSAAVKLSNGAGIDDIIAYGKKLIGTKYHYGGNNPTKGFDCSGFVSYVLKNFDVNVGRSSRDMAANGKAIKKDELAKGDLVFFATMGGNRISHVGLYIGGGDFIHSTDWGGGVVISNLKEDYYVKHYVKAARIF